MAETCADCEKAAHEWCAVLDSPQEKLLTADLHKAHLRGLSQGDARTLAAAIALFGRHNHHIDCALLDDSYPGVQCNCGLQRLIDKLAHLQPASAALDAAKLAFGKRVQEAYESNDGTDALLDIVKRLLSLHGIDPDSESPSRQPFQRLDVNEQLALIAYRAWKNKSRALDLKALLSTSAVKEDSSERD